MAEIKILIGLHDPKYLKLLCGWHEPGNILIDGVDNLADMLNKARSNDYWRYIMDINLGYPDSENIDPAKRVYEIVRPKIESGLARFLGISLNDIAVKRAKDLGIPAMHKCDFSMRGFLRQLEQLTL